ncbi:hypothetical protein GCM10022200_07910 [Microbacterium awajiense]|uniref:ABC transporter domain-containing protein n=1 Tax=Microbacterium awajiense TaxID=415214 RepID=A0ABP7A9S0_9MICO
MTASLPAPRDDGPPEAAPVHTHARVVPLKPDAGAAARLIAERLAADPGPPPPLPPDLRDESENLVIPPRPPLPPAVAPVADALADEDAEPEDEDVEDLAVGAPVADEAEDQDPDDLDDDTGEEALGVDPATDVDDAVAQEEAEAEEGDVSDVDVADATETEQHAQAAEAVIAEPEVAEPVEDTAPPLVFVGDTAAVVFDDDVPEVLTAAEDAVGETALSLRGVTKSFGSTRAVEAIDLTVPAGTFYGLVGPNGAGKTTTLSMIAGLLRPDKGAIEVGGIDATADPQSAKKLMGVLPDRLHTFDRLTGRQLLYYYGVLRGMPSAIVESRTTDLARAFDLTEALGRVVSDYSAGMTKKVMLAGALIHAPRLLVLDEPFEAVDPVSSAIILDILSTYVAHGGTVILSSHGMELVERVCSRVGVIVAGQVLAEGTVEQVRGELTLEQRFVELAGGLSDVEGLEWLHTYSD